MKLPSLAIIVLLTGTLLAGSAIAVAQQQTDSALPIADRIRRPVHLDLDATTLRSVCKQLGEQTGLAIVLEDLVVDVDGVGEQQRFDGLFRGWPLTALLDTLLKPAELGWTVRGQAIVITSKRNARSLLSTRFFALPASCTSATEEQAIIDAVRKDVASNSWQGQGGWGTIRVVDTTLWVQNTWQVHRQIERRLPLLAARNPNSAEQILDDPSGNVSESHSRGANQEVPASQNQEADPDEAPLVVRSYSLERLLKKQLNMSDGDQLERFSDLITEIVAPGSWEEVGGPGTISRRGTRLSIAQTLAVHADIDSLLSQLASTDWRKSTKPLSVNHPGYDVMRSAVRRPLPPVSFRKTPLAVHRRIQAELAKIAKEGLPDDFKFEPPPKFGAPAPGVNVGGSF